MLDVSFELKGLDELERKLNELKETAINKNYAEEERLKTIRFAMRKAANVIRNKAIEKAKAFDDPNTDTAVWKNIRVAFDGRHFRRTGEFRFKIGVAGGATSKEDNDSNKGGDTYYWRFLEFGTQHMSAKPFLRPAMQESMDQAIETFYEEYKKSIDRAIRKTSRGGQ